MLSISQNTTLFLLPSRIGCTPVAPLRVMYEKWQGMERTLSGTIVEKLPIAQRGYPGVYTFDYRIIPDPGMTNLTSHWISEDAVQWHLRPPTCPDCGGHGYLSITGDNDVPCERCNPVEMEVTF